MKYIIILILFLTTSLWAQDSRWIDMEWDVVPDAKEYELELFEETEGKEFSRGKFKVGTPKWSHAVSPGKYFLTIRSVDDRGVPGEWSEKIPLKVKILSPIMIRPSVGEKIDDSQVSFEWTQVPQATAYQLVIRNAKKDVVHDATHLGSKESVFIKDLTNYSWAVFALSDGDDSLPSTEWPEKSFRAFERVGGDLDAPSVKVVIEEKISLSWGKVTDAQSYEMDYFPPPKMGDKNRRFKLKNAGFVLPKSKLKDGITTLTIRSMAPGYQDSPKTIVKILKDDEAISTDSIETGKSKISDKPLNQLYWRNQLFYSLSLAQYGYSSKNYDTDTKLDQSDLKGIGGNLEWIHQKSPAHNQHKIDLSMLKLSAGKATGTQKRMAYDYIWSYASESKIWALGTGLSYLDLPVFTADRTNNKFFNDSISSIGPELTLSMVDALTPTWHLHANFVFAYHPLILSSPSDEADAFGWMRVQVRFMKNFSRTSAMFFGGEYQKWDQSENKNTSKLNGWSGVVGLKHGW